jgi:hypothetical protein
LAFIRHLICYGSLNWSEPLLARDRQGVWAKHAQGLPASSPNAPYQV